ncbi:MAG: hypothetical protein EOP82_10170 [Variovorax sp.]|nr:MAG: hypothetical protein EOP82_10170 [Variovorax sp.]
MFGQEFDLVMHALNWHEDRATFHDATGRLPSVPAVWTDLISEDPFNAMAAGRAAFRVRELLDLAQMIRRLKS